MTEWHITLILFVMGFAVFELRSMNKNLKDIKDALTKPGSSSENSVLAQLHRIQSDVQMSKDTLKEIRNNLYKALDKNN